MSLHKHIPQRWDGKNQWYFVTVVTRNREAYFQNDTNCSLLMEACRTIHQKHSYRLGALVILPNHWHALIKPKEDEVIESIVGAIKQYVFHHTRKNDRPIIHWQKRFLDHRLRDEPDFYQHLEYIRLNPFKHELVSHDETWKWCFIHDEPFGTAV